MSIQPATVRSQHSTGQHKVKVTRPRGHLSAEEHRRKELMLTQHEPAKVRQTTDAAILKHGNMLLLSTESGDIPLAHGHGYGLFYGDTRYLGGYTLSINKHAPVVLSYVDARGYETQHDLSNPRMRGHATGALIENNTVAIRRERFIRAGVLYEMVHVRNYGKATADLRIVLRYRPSFEDIAAIKGFVRGHRPSFGGVRLIGMDGVEMRANGADRYTRTMTIMFSPDASELEVSHADFDCWLEPGADYHLQVTIALSEYPILDRFEGLEQLDAAKREHKGSATNYRRPRHPQASRDAALRWLERSERIWLAGSTAVETSNPLFNRVIKRSLLDLWMLRSRLDGLHYFAAGIPWFNTLFGRDACIVAIQTMPFGHLVAGETLQLLARYQARELDTFRDAEPGKILHEYRGGELARTGYIPQSPAYYGTVDATLLFLILMGEYVDWSGDLDLARKLRPNIDAALDWIDNYADHDGDGYLDYVGEYATGLINQGWKDAGNSIPDADGSQVKPPVAVCEVQSYLYRAWRQTATVLRATGEPQRATGEPQRAEELERRASELQQRFERDFWSEELGCYLLALQEGGRPAPVVSSNAGQVLWGGITDPSRAARVAERLMRADTFSGWGVRTLSSREKAYNPISYHLGSVWPHDNALIAAGFERYGQDDAAIRILSGLFDAAAGLHDYRLPELFSGYERREGEQRPVGFPVACSPQAWAAGAIPHVMWTLLGLRANAPEKRLRIVRPVLPDWLDWLELRHIKVGGASLDLRFERETPSKADAGGQDVRVEVLAVHGDVDVERTDEIGDPGLFT